MEKGKIVAALLGATLLLASCGQSAKPAATKTEGEAATAVTLTGKAEGYGGPIEVEVEKKGDDILAVKVKSHTETEEIGGSAMETITKAIVEKDSIEVDGVTGATVTSDAIKEAVKNAK